MRRSRKAPLLLLYSAWVAVAMAAEPVIVADDDDWEMETRVDNELGSAAFADLIRVRLLVPSVYCTRQPLPVGSQLVDVGERERVGHGSSATVSRGARTTVFVLFLVPVSPPFGFSLTLCSAFAAAAVFCSLHRPPPPSFLPKGDRVFWFLSVMFVVLAISVCVTWRKHRDTLCAVYIATGGMTSTNLAKTVAWCVCLLASPRAMAGGGGTLGPLF